MLPERRDANPDEHDRDDDSVDLRCSVLVVLILFIDCRVDSACTDEAIEQYAGR